VYATARPHETGGRTRPIFQRRHPCYDLGVVPSIFANHQTAMQRRTWMLAGLALLAGCSAAKRTVKKSRGRADRRAKGPKTMGNLLVEGYIADLKKGSKESRIAAAEELANLGNSAKAALPALTPLAKHADAKLRAAATAAIKAIEK
jgi:hypothetical protein